MTAFSGFSASAICGACANRPNQWVSELGHNARAAGWPQKHPRRNRTVRLRLCRGLAGRLAFLGASVRNRPHRCAVRLSRRRRAQAHWIKRGWWCHHPRTPCAHRDHERERAQGVRHRGKPNVPLPTQALGVCACARARVHKRCALATHLVNGLNSRYHQCSEIHEHDGPKELADAAGAPFLRHHPKVKNTEMKQMGHWQRQRPQLCELPPNALPPHLRLISFVLGGLQ